MRLAALTQFATALLAAPATHLAALVRTETRIEDPNIRVRSTVPITEMRLAGRYLAFILDGNKRDRLVVIDVAEGGAEVSRSEVATIRDFDLDASGGTVLTYGYRRHPATHFLGWTPLRGRDVRVLARGVKPRGVALAGGRVLYQRGRRLVLQRLKGGTTRRVTTFTRARPRAGAIDLDSKRAVWATRGRIVSLSPVTGGELGTRLRERDLTAAPAALNLVENRSPARRDEIAAMLAEVSPSKLGGEAPAHVIGVTGPPGAGKSTLLSALAATWRERDRTVAVLAVDPTSKRSGGALLGDRARIESDPADRGLFIRSTAAGERLGGLAPATRAAAQALAAAFDVVVIETVGVGQSETEVAEAADTIAVVVQPGSGDTLQFIKAGIMEIPDVLVVTKADLGEAALRARRHLNAALRSLGERETAVVSVSSVPPEQGIGELADALDAHRARLDLAAARRRARRLGALADFIAEHGERGLRALGGRRAAVRLLSEQKPGLEQPALTRLLEEWASASG